MIFEHIHCHIAEVFIGERFQQRDSFRAIAMFFQEVAYSFVIAS